MVLVALNSAAVVVARLGRAPEVMVVLEVAVAVAAAVVAARPGYR